MPEYHTSHLFLEQALYVWYDLDSGNTQALFASVMRKILFYTRLLLFGHILNPLWKSRMERRLLRGRVTAKAVSAYISKIPVPPSTPCTQVRPETERVFSIWFQGEAQAPLIVKSCLDSIRRNAPLELMVLDQNTIFDWVDLPDYVVEKWRAGKISYAHFADICRVDLLWRHGGIWMDATDFMPHPLPDFVLQEPFFVYLSGKYQAGSYSGIQNCFIRSQAGNPLLGAWRNVIFEYWKREDYAIDYFVHQMLFQHAVRHDQTAADHYDRMPKIQQDSTHLLWYLYRNAHYDKDEYERLTQEGIFQKTDFKSPESHSPIPETYADYIVNYVNRQA